MTAIPYAIRRSDRARRVRVSVEGDGAVEVVLPRGAPERAAREAVSELRPWIERRLRALRRAHAEVDRRPGTVPYLDETLQLIAQEGRTRVTRKGDQLLVPSAATAQGAALERWYRRQALKEIAPRLEQACRAAALPAPGRLSIRSQRTRWASCSPDGGMSFNWRLLLAPAAVLDYVIWHEVCHLEIADHSARFWARVAHHCPDHREHSRWLRRYGATLAL
ncbi:MAG: M48 family metallopeptidase [Solirubrobacteraceae bacterium]|nr:MAG: M48 family peptidase [Solirubrobacterales bacterium]